MTARTLTATVAGLVLASAFHVAPASAALTLQGTRVIFPAEKREVNVRLDNPGAVASIVQVWIDEGDRGATPSTAQAPFVIRPPVFRLDSGRTQILRVSAPGASMPQHKESLYWFNAREVPLKTTTGESTVDGAEMHLIVRTRVKLFYRPKGLTAQGARLAPEQLVWTLQPATSGCTLVASNPTPYHVNLNRIVGGREAIDIGDGVVAPMEEGRFGLSSSQCTAMSGSVSFEFVNDHGGVKVHKASLKND